MVSSALLYSPLLSGRRWVLCYPSWVEASSKCSCCRLRISYWWPPDAEDRKVLLAHCCGYFNVHSRNPPNNLVHGIGSQQYVWYLGRTRPRRVLHWNRNHHYPDRADRQCCPRRSGHCDSMFVPVSVSWFRGNPVVNCQRGSAIFKGPTSGAPEQRKGRRGDCEEGTGEPGLCQDFEAGSARSCPAMLC